MAEAVGIQPNTHLKAGTPSNITAVFGIMVAVFKFPVLGGDPGAITLIICRPDLSTRVVSMNLESIGLIKLIVCPNDKALSKVMPINKNNFLF